MAKRAVAAVAKAEPTQQPMPSPSTSKSASRTVAGSVQTKSFGVSDGLKILCSALGAIVLMVTTVAPVLAWGDDGHQIVAYIAAAHLTPSARNGVARILGVDPRDADAVANAMAEASTRPDLDFRPRDPSTGPWHFVDLCLQDTEADIPRRCEGYCVTAKIDEYETRLRTEHYDKWGADGDLAFLLHFVGDIHQPMHDVTNADKGGNCIKVGPGNSNLHRAWDTTFVEALEEKLQTRRESGRSRRTAEALDAEYQANPPRQDLTWERGAPNDIAWESTLLARDKIYRELGLKTEPCLPKIHDCETEAPAEVQAEVVHFDEHYVAEAATIAGRQLYIAGMRLASLLNQIWPSR